MAKMWLEDLLNPELCEHYYIAKWAPVDDSGKLLPLREKIFDTEEDAINFIVNRVIQALADGYVVEVHDAQ